MAKYSNCCGAEPKGNGDCDSEDIGICPCCKDHCEYIEVCDDCGEEDCVCPKLKTEDIYHEMNEIEYQDRDKKINGINN